MNQPERGVFCNRTLNLRAIRAIGYDMDYTLIHYHSDQWERRAYEYLKESFRAKGWPVQNLQFDPQMASRGVIIDTQLGNLVKANRFGFIKAARHGTSAMAFDVQRTTYSRTIIDLADHRWVFLNTLFSLSEGCIYSQLVDLLDQRMIPGVLGYTDLYQQLREVFDATHMEGRLKADIIANPEKFVELDADIPLTLLDQRNAGKTLVLITNSEWSYTHAMMSYAFDRYLPQGGSWRDLFDYVVVNARKPHFFTSETPILEIANSEGLLKTHLGTLERGKAYFGGNARDFEKHLGFNSDEILYVGDHMFGDVHVTKNILRWRTALIIRELEEEIQETTVFLKKQKQLEELMREKAAVEQAHCQARTELQRLTGRYSDRVSKDEKKLQALIHSTRAGLLELDQKIGPLAKAATAISNPFWGLLLHSGNDKSYFAYQMERYADIYMSRVSNLLGVTPFAYLRSPRGTLPHDFPVSTVVLK